MLKPIGVTVLIATPFAWYATNNRLQQFVYWIDMGWLTSVTAGLSVGLIALFTIGFQSVKAARAHPIKRLKTE